MPYRVLGSSGLRVARMALGTGTFGQPGWGCTEAVSRAIYERYREAGGNLLDTANKYAGGESEAIVGRIVGESGTNWSSEPSTRQLIPPPRRRTRTPTATIARTSGSLSTARCDVSAPTTWTSSGSTHGILTLLSRR